MRPYFPVLRFKQMLQDRGPAPDRIDVMSASARATALFLLPPLVAPAQPERGVRDAGGLRRPACAKVSRSAQVNSIARQRVSASISTPIAFGFSAFGEERPQQFGDRFHPDDGGNAFSGNQPRIFIEIKQILDA